MLGIHHVKFESGTYVLVHRNGNVVKKGRGLAFFYFEPHTSIVAIPTGSVEAQFIFEETTSDYQTVTVQGQVTFRIGDPDRLAQFFDYTVDGSGHLYRSDDPDELAQRVLNAVNVLVKKEVERLSVKEAIRSSEVLAERIEEAIREQSILGHIGIEVLAVSIVSVLPTKETSRALEAGTREQILKEADDAIYRRRNASVEQERVIKENELSTKIAIENKEREIKENKLNTELAVEIKKKEIKEQRMEQELALEQGQRRLREQKLETELAMEERNHAIREKKLETERAIQERTLLMEREEMDARIQLETENRKIVELQVKNAKSEADARTHGMNGLMNAIGSLDPTALQALATSGMQPAQIAAAAVRDLLGNAGKIGQINITPDLLGELFGHGNGKRSAAEFHEHREG